MDKLSPVNDALCVWRFLVDGVKKGRKANHVMLLIMSASQNSNSSCVVNAYLSRNVNNQNGKENTSYKVPFTFFLLLLFFYFIFLITAYSVYG